MEKSNKKYKAAADKKRLEKLFEEEDMMIHLSREIIATERVPTEQLYQDWNPRGTGVGRQKKNQGMNKTNIMLTDRSKVSLLSTGKVSCR